jgi:hypothetical protein
MSHSAQRPGSDPKRDGASVHPDRILEYWPLLALLAGGALTCAWIGFLIWLMAYLIGRW